MVESVILLLIYICLVVGVCWLVIWVIGMLGIPVPQQVINVLWVIVVLVVLLLLWRTFAPVLGGGHLLR